MAFLTSTRQARKNQNKKRFKYGKLFKDILTCLKRQFNMLKKEGFPRDRFYKS